MKSTTKSTCGLDLQKDYLSAVFYLADKREASVVTIQPLPSAASDDTEVWNLWEAELRKIRGQLKHYGSPVMCGIPADFAVIKLCSLDADEDNPREALEWELSQQIIGSADDYRFDFQETGSDGADVKRYLVASYRKEYVDRLAAMIRKIKLEPRIGDLDLFGLINVFEANYPEKKAAPTLLAHCENRFVKLVLTQHGGFVDYHCFEHTAPFLDPEPYAAAFGTEIERFKTITGRRDIASEIYCTGSFLKSPEHRATLLQAANGAQILNPFKEITCHLEGVGEQQLLEHSTQLAVATGLALRIEE